MRLAFPGRWFSLFLKNRLAPRQPGRAAEAQDAESQFILGEHFRAGERPDEEQAAQWYLKAAAQGHGTAQFHLGLMYGQGRGVSRNETAAVLWLRKSAELGHAGAQYHLGVRLYRASRAGRQSEPSETRIEAFKWLQLAVTQAHHGAESAREFAALGMTRQEVDEGSRRAAAFAATGTTASAPAA